MAKNPIEEAESLFKRRRWAHIISLLEPLSAVYRDNARYSVLLGAAYLHKEDIGGAYSAFRRAQNQDYKDIDAAYGLAAVYIRRGEGDKAVQLYVDVLERYPREARAKRGLDFLRRSQNQERAQSSHYIRRFYPEPPARWGIPVAIAIVAIVIALGWNLSPLAVALIRKAMPQREGIAAISLSEAESAAPVGSEGGFSIVLTEKDAVATFERAKRLFSEYRDEAALVELNRLSISNATRQVKAKAEALARYVREPSFLSMPDKFDYSQVAASPALYAGVGVVWKGLPANVTSSADQTSFDLLVGYHDRKRLEGIVPVRAAFQLDLLPDGPVEVLARIRTSDGKSFYLECLAVHEL